MEWHFHKYEQAGGDFILIDARENNFDPSPDEVRAVCRRRFGVGAEGLVVLENDPEADFGIRSYAPNGNPWKACGHDRHCAVLFAEHLGIGGSVKMFRAAGTLCTADIAETDHRGGGIVASSLPDVAQVIGSGNMFFLHTGEPCYVEFVRDVDMADVHGIGHRIRHSLDFEEIGGTNVCFAQFAGDGRIKIRTYDRGADQETVASGTAAAACAIAGHVFRQSHNRRFEIKTRVGGVSRVSFSTRGNGLFNDIRIEESVRHTFSGTVTPDFFVPKG